MKTSIQRIKRGKHVIMVRHGRGLENMTRDFDIEFWQRLGPDAIFEAAWQLVVDAHRLKGGKESELRLRRNVVRFSKK